MTIIIKKFILLVLKGILIKKNPNFAEVDFSAF